MSADAGRWAVGLSGDPRVPAIADRHQLRSDERRHFDAIERSRGGVRGPFQVLLNRPPLAGRVAALGAVVRFEGHLAADVRELTILATAREWECAYVWAAHDPLAREAGVPGSAIDVVATRGAVAALPDRLATVVRFARELLEVHDVSDGTFESAVDALGAAGVTELTVTVGYYGLIAGVCEALGVRPDEPAAAF